VCRPPTSTDIAVGRAHRGRDGVDAGGRPTRPAGHPPRQAGRPAAKIVAPRFKPIAGRAMVIMKPQHAVFAPDARLNVVAT